MAHVNRPVPVVFGGPESLFRVDSLGVDGMTSRASMVAGPWMLGSDGRVASGSLAVLIDDVLGYATVAPQEREFWSVSTDITLDLFDSLHAPTSRFYAEAEAVHVNELGCFATGRVVNDDGELVALCSQRGRYVPMEWAAVDAIPVFAEQPKDTDDIATLIGARPSLNGGIALESSAVHENALSNLHGGLSMCASDIVASAALAQLDAPGVMTTSIRIAYSRPVPRGALVEYTATVRYRGRSFGVVDVVGTVAGKACTIAHVTAQPSP
jgi:acyl-coenzyme A thioesterase PaaI-like protein